jgi:hypothetical protein
MSEKNKKVKEYPDFDPTRDLSQATNPSNAPKPLTKEEIVQAQKKARSAAEASRILGVSYHTYKKYATLFGVHQDLINERGRGISKGTNEKSQAKLDDILTGKHPSYPSWSVKNRLIASGRVADRCEKCGFNERRITDHKVPLALDYLDGDTTNHTFENLRLLCLNCYFLTVGNIKGPTKQYN